MSHTLSLLRCLAVVAALALPDFDAAAEERFEANWDSLRNYECPEWFRDAKFGIYTHWGPYSAAEGSRNTDWYGRNMYKPGHPNNVEHRQKFGEVSKFGYKDLIPLFTAEKFDAEEWAQLFEASGARFAGPVGEHADGFSMWPSAVNPWNAGSMGPKRDVVAELEKAIRSRGMKFMVSMHHQWLWGWYPTWDDKADASDPQYASLYGPRLPETAQAFALPGGKPNNLRAYPLPDTRWQETWLEKVEEVVLSYSPDLLWFDNRMQILSENTRQRMAALYLNHAAKMGQEATLTFKRPDLPLGVGTVDLERSRMPDIYPEPWLTDTSISRSSWSYARDLEYYSTDRLIDDLVDIVSKNGCMLLNVAPHPDGNIPEAQRERLLEMGDWLKVNGEAIYGTRPWLIYGEGPSATPVGHLADLHFDGFGPEDVRFTTRDGQLYAILLDWPEGGTVNILSLAESSYSGAIESVELLASSERLEWTRNESGLEVALPENPPSSFAVVLKINR